MFTTEWGVRSSIGVFTCKSEEHARGMIRSMSPIVGPMEGRSIVSRQVGSWVAVDSARGGLTVFNYHFFSSREDPALGDRITANCGKRIKFRGSKISRRRPFACRACVLLLRDDHASLVADYNALINERVTS